MSDLKDKMAEVIKRREARVVTDDAAAKKNADEVSAFFRGPVTEAFAELREALEANGRKVETSIGSMANFTASHGGDTEVRIELHATGNRVHPVSYHVDRSNGRPFRSHGYFRSGHQNYTAADLTKDEIVAHIFEEWRRHVARG